MFTALAIVAFIAALYCFSAYAMNASFSVAAPERTERYAHSAAWWGLTGLASIATGIALAIAAWRSRRK
jgi:hypothetical protein